MGLVEKQSIQDIADAIRNRNGLTTLYKPREMDEAILNLYSTTKVNNMLDYILPCHEEEATDFTIKYADSDRPCSISELEGNTSQSGTPTPSSPVEVKTVSGDNDIVTCGKNIFETKAQGNFSYGTTSTWNIDNDIITMSVNDSTFQGGAINLTTGATGRWASSYISDKKLTDNGGTYTFTLVKNGTITQATSGNVYLYYFYYNDTGTTGNGYLLVNNSLETVTKTITLASDQHIGAVCIYSQYVTCDNLKLKVMLEKGSTATTYEPYVGNSYRVDFGGKNLLKIVKDSTTINGVTFTQNEDGSISVKGTATANAFYTSTTLQQIEPNRLMKLSGCPNGGSTSTYRLILRVRSNTTTNIVTISNTGGGANIPKYENAHYILGEIWVYSGQTVDLTFYPQLEYINSSSEPATAYSPYVSNPIELCKIGNYVDKLKRAEGKNKVETIDIFNGFPYADNGQTITYTSSANSITYKKCAYVQANTTYTLSWRINTVKAVGIRDVKIADENAVQLQNLAYSNANNNRTYTFTPSYSGWLYVSLDTNATEVMINEGSTALPYEPYGNNWYIEKNIGKVVLNGSESWDTRNGATSYAYYVSNVFNMNKAVGLTSHFVFYSGGSTSAQTRECIASANTTKDLALFTNNSSMDTVANLKTWLSNNNVTVYYSLATPTYETITNENLIEQLNNIQNIELIENLCYVDWIGEEKPKMKLFCYLDKDKIIEEITG